MSIWNITKSLFPIVWESILGKSTIIDALKYNKVRLLIVAYCVLSPALFIQSGKKIISLSEALVNLQITDAKKEDACLLHEDTCAKTVLGSRYVAHPPKPAPVCKPVPLQKVGIAKHKLVKKVVPKKHHPKKRKHLQKAKPHTHAKVHEAYRHLKESKDD